jgi:phosphomethylpyrimidine synthase
MCGHDWCSVRISKEITLFVSGKDADYQWDKPKISDALNDTQKEILEQRGVLTPEEIHRLASKTKGAMELEGRKAACHSDLVDGDSASHLQSERLDPETLEPLEQASTTS